MNNIEQVTLDFEEHFKYVESMGGDCRSARFDFEHNVSHYLRNQYHICSKCKRPEQSTYHEPIGSRLVKNKTCFFCDLWMDREKLLNKGSTFVIDNQMFTVGSPAIDIKGNQSFLGHGGSAFEITTVDGDVIKTNNLWNGGDLPFWLKHYNVGNTIRSVNKSSLVA